MIVTAKTPTISLTKGGTTSQATCNISLSGDTTFKNGKTLTLRVDNYDIASYDETILAANAFIDFDDVVVQSSAVSCSRKGMVEAFNANFSSLSSENQQAMQTLDQKHYSVMQSRSIGNIYSPETTVPDYETENDF